LPSKCKANPTTEKKGKGKIGHPYMEQWRSKRDMGEVSGEVIIELRFG
jgi:hypothetical protein